MRILGAHLLEDKMDEVTHYIHSHPSTESVHMSSNSLALNVLDDGGSRVTVMHPQNFSSPLCRQVSVGEQVGEGPWTEELLDPDGRLAAIVAQLAQHSRAPHPHLHPHPHPPPHQHQPHPPHHEPHHPPHHGHHHHKVAAARAEVDNSVILDGSMRLYNGQTLDPQSESIIVHVPQLPSLPPLQEMKRCQETDWFNNKSKNVTTLKDNTPILVETESPVLEMCAGASPAQKHQSKKSLPHKKRISRKLKKNNGNSTPQQDIVVIGCNEEVQHEEILPDNFAAGMQHQEQLPEDTHHITHEVHPILICQLCGEFYGEEQLKFYHHLKQHYEPHATIIIENPVSDLGIDKMTNTCIVDNVATLPDSIVELSLENTVPKTMYQTIDKHIMYTSSDKTLNYTSNKVQYSMASMDKEPVSTSEAEKSDLYDTLDKLELYSCAKCNKSFRKQRQCEAHIREAHSNAKLEDMSEFSEPEDLMEGIHVSVEEGGEQYEQTLLPHLTVENGHVHQEHVRHWYLRGGNASGGQISACGSEGAYCPVCPAANPAREQTHEPQQLVLKEEVLQRILETNVTEEQIITDNMMPDSEAAPEPGPEPEPEPPSEEPQQDNKKVAKKFDCPHCSRVFLHRSSLLYHVLSHEGKQHVCRECGKGFYTPGALKVHKRVHNGDRPYKCEECGRDFRQWSDLKYHKVIHSKQKRFKCDFCEKEFARKYSLIIHRRIHTGERNYKCEYCTKSFRASCYRNSHMRTHTGDRPYKCEECGKCFRVAFDLRRHILTHDKARNKLEQLKPKVKEENDKDVKQSKDQTPPKMKKIAVASTTRLPNIVKVDKKQKASKKCSKKGAPNVTVTENNGQFKVNAEYTNNVEVFNTRQEVYSKFKEVYADSDINFKNQTVSYKQEQNDREFAILKPMFRGNLLDDSVKPVYAKVENTDGKMHIYTHVEKHKEYNSIVTNTQVPISDVRHADREVTREANGETIENVFFERLTALCNIPAV